MPTSSPQPVTLDLHVLWRDDEKPTSHARKGQCCRMYPLQPPTSPASLATSPTSPTPCALLLLPHPESCFSLMPPFPNTATTAANCRITTVTAPVRLIETNLRNQTDGEDDDPVNGSHVASLRRTRKAKVAPCAPSGEYRATDVYFACWPCSPRALLAASRSREPSLGRSPPTERKSVAGATSEEILKRNF